MSYKEDDGIVFRYSSIDDVIHSQGIIEDIITEAIDEELDVFL